MPEPPRLTDDIRRQINQRVRNGASTPDIVEVVVNVLWPKLLGDARDRTASVLHAARGLLESENLPAETVAARRRGLRRALDELDHPAAWPGKAKGSSDG